MLQRRTLAIALVLASGSKACAEDCTNLSAGYRVAYPRRLGYRESERSIAGETPAKRPS